MSRPNVLLVDDMPAAAALMPSDVDYREIDPNESDFVGQLAKLAGDADLILLDQQLDESSQDLGATRGTVLATELREWARAAGKQIAPLVLFTADVEAFISEVPAVGPQVPLDRGFVGFEHLLAPVLDVEWVLFKSSSQAQGAISAFASASKTLKAVAGTDGTSPPELATFLNLRDAVDWGKVAKSQIARSRPPITQQPTSHSSAKSMTVVFRWLAHRALPYAGLFLSDYSAAWTLGISVESFRDLVAQGNIAALRDVEYTGPLAGLYERRWWAAGVESFASSVRAAPNILIEAGLVEKDFLPPGKFIPVCGANLIECDLIAVEKAVPVRPPGWPAEASDPWVTKDVIESYAGFAQLVDEDR